MARFTRGRQTFVVLAVCGAALAALFIFAPHTHASGESIKSFDVRAQVFTDGSVQVTEQITYDFGTNERHGIFRDIPLMSDLGPNLGIVVKSVADEEGSAYQYEVTSDGAALHIKIGDPTHTIRGVHAYFIDYELYGAIRQFADYDEFYWNATGNQWTVPIDEAKISVFLPAITPLSDVTVDCYTGAVRSDTHDCTTHIGEETPSDDATSTVPFADVTLQHGLQPGEGLTVAVGFPKAIIVAGSIPDNAITATNSAGASSGSEDTPWPIALLGGVWVSIVFGVIIARIGRAVGRGGSHRVKPIRIPAQIKGKPVVVQYDPPDALTAVDIGTLDDRSVDGVDLSATIIDLAIKGYLKIKYTKTVRRFLPDSEDYEFVKLKDGNDLVHPAYRVVYNLLFTSSDRLTLSDLQAAPTVGYAALQQAQKAMSVYLTTQGYFEEGKKGKPEKLKHLKKLKLFGPLVIVVSILFLLNIFPGGAAVFAGLIGLAGVAAVVWAVWASATRLTSKGIETIAKVLGFRKFLQATEKDRLDMLNAPSLQPEIFEKFLPYAMVFGVEKQWAEKFEKLYNLQPTWFEGYPSGMNAVLLADSLNHFGSSFASAAAPPTSSGVGGGGFSGGGSGGGGGGSW